MPIPTNDEILQILDRLEFLPAEKLESEHLEFKAWSAAKESRKHAVESAICFANAGGGVVVFGVKDGVIGRSAAIHGVDSAEGLEWQKEIFNETSPNLTVEIVRLSVPEGKGTLLVVRIASRAGTGPYGTSQGVFKRRIGTSCMPLDPQSWSRAQVSSGAVDWSGQFSECREPLDREELRRARRFISAAARDSELLELSDEDFLEALGVSRGGRPTNAALLLFGGEASLARLYPQHAVHYVLLQSETKTSRNDSLRSPLLSILDHFDGVFSGPANPTYEFVDGLIRIEIPAYPRRVVREALLNAVTHRDYLNPQEVLVRQDSSELVVSSPGGFLPGITPENILRCEPASRNRCLAEAFQKLRLVERAGLGRRRIFHDTIELGKHPPAYHVEGERVILRIFNGSYDQSMVVAVRRWQSSGRELDLDGLLILSHLRRHEYIDTTDAARILQLPRDEARTVLDRMANLGTGIVERRGRTKAVTYHLTKAMSRELKGAVAYSRNRGIESDRYAELVRQYVSREGSITPRECRDLLGLGESQSARVEVSRYLRNWSNGAGAFLEGHGKGPARRFELRTR